MKSIYVVLVFVLMVSSFAVAKEAEVSAEASARGGILPDSPLWGIDTAIENIEFALTFDQEAKIRKRLEIARERLVEAKIMAEKHNIEAAEKAQIAHQRNLIALRNRLKMVEGNNATDELRANVEFEHELESQEHEAASFAKLQIMVKGDLNAEQKSRLFALFESFRNESSSARLEVRQEREKIRIKLQTRELLTEEQVDEMEDEAEIEAEIEANATSHGAEVVAAQFVRISQNAISMAEHKVAMIQNSTAEAEAHLDAAVSLQAEAKAALESGRYDEARSLALQARREARSAVIVSAGRAAADDLLDAEIRSRGSFVAASAFVSSSGGSGRNDGDSASGSVKIGVSG